MKKITLLILLCGTLISCSKHTQDGPPKQQININRIKNPTPQKLKKSRYGNPKSYVVFGKRYYVLSSEKNYNKTGIASWYGTKFHGKLTSTREPYNMYKMTAASPELPIPCYVEVTNLNNGKSIIVKVNDRGPFAPNRIIDLSYVAAAKLGMIQKGTAHVRVRAIHSSHDYPSTPKPTRFVAHQGLSKTPLGYLQVGAFSSMHGALTLKEQLSHFISQPIGINASRPANKSFYRVTIGPFNTRIDQESAIKNLKEHGFKSIIKST